MVIYKITNKVNGKVYIGQTVRSIKIRWKQHCKKSTGCSAIRDAIQKYGKDSFEIEIIYTASSKEELDEKEKYFIEQYNSLSPNGYNLKIGGEHGTYTEETRLKMSLARKGRFTGKDSPIAKPIKCVETGQIFESSSAASLHMKIQRSDICSVLKGNRARAGKHTFVYVKENYGN